MTPMKIIACVLLVCLFAQLAAEPVAASSHLRARLAEKIAPESEHQEIIDEAASFRLGRQTAAQRRCEGRYSVGGFLAGFFFPGVSLLILTAFTSGESPGSVPDNVFRQAYINGYRKGAARRNRSCSILSNLAGTALIAAIVAISYAHVLSHPFD